MRTEVHLLKDHTGIERTKNTSLEKGSFYLINHTDVVGLGHCIKERVIFIDHEQNAHDIQDTTCYWTGSYALEVIKKLEKLIINF